MAEIRIYTKREFFNRVYNGGFFSWGHFDREFLLTVINQRCIRQYISDAPTFRYTPLMICAQYGHPKIVRHLLENSADFAICNNYAICLAAESGHLKTVKLLVEYGADITVRNNYAIRQAIYWRRYRVVKYLLNLNVYSTAVIRAITRRTINDYGNGDLEKLLDRYVCERTDIMTKGIRN